MKRFFRIYTPFAVNELKREMAYKGSFYLFILVSLFGSFISYFLWQAIYASSATGVLGGLTQKEIVVYVFMTYVTSTLVNVDISENINEDVVKGSIATNLIKPIDYRLSLFARALGTCVYRLLAPAVFIWLGVEIYKAGAGLPLVWGDEVCYLFSCLLSLGIYLCFEFCFGMIAFFTSYIFGLQMAKSALLLFLTGQLLPLSFFPAAVQRVFDFLPFSSMAYTPVMVTLGRYRGMALAGVLLRQLFWVVALYLLGSLIWRRVTRRMCVLGG